MQPLPSPTKVPLRAETLQRLRKLKMIAVAATGYDVIDISLLQGQWHRSH